MRKAKQSTAKNVMVMMVGAADHITGLAGLTLTITASKDGAAFASISPTVTDRGSGWYNVALTAAHTDTLGDLALHVTGASADPVDMVVLVEGGSTDADVSSRMATFTLPTNFSSLSITGAGLVDITQAGADKAWSTTARLLTAGTNIVLAKGTGVTGFNDLSAAQVNAEADTALADVGVTTTITGRIDAAVSSRLASASYTTPDNAGIAVAAVAAAAANTKATTIQAKTDNLTFTVAGKLDVNLLVVNGVTLQGAGTSGDKWRPA